MFTTTKLAGDRTLVKGTDFAGAEGTIILDARQWNELTAREDHSLAHEKFDSALEEFFAPLNEAIKEIARDRKPQVDSLFYIVEQEAQEAVEGKSEILIELNHDTAILRLIDSNPHTERLIWVGDDLEILAEEQDSQPRVRSYDVDGDGIPDDATKVFDSLINGSPEQQKNIVADLLGVPVEDIAGNVNVGLVNLGDFPEPPASEGADEAEPTDGDAL